MSLLKDLKREISSLALLMIESEPAIVLDNKSGRGVLLSVRAWCEKVQFIQARNEHLLKVSSVLRERHQE